MKATILTVTIATILILAACQDGSKAPVAPRDLCTEIGCSDGLSLVIHPTALRFAAGRYTVHVKSSGGVERSCSFEVSDDPSRCASGHCVKAEDCNGVYLVGSPDRDQVRIDYPVIEGPIEVQIERDGMPIVNETTAPVYAVSRPNGPECPPACRMASISAIVP